MTRGRGLEQTFTKRSEPPRCPVTFPWQNTKLNCSKQQRSLQMAEYMFTVGSLKENEESGHQKPRCFLRSEPGKPASQPRAYTEGLGSFAPTAVLGCLIFGLGRALEGDNSPPPLHAIGFLRMPIPT